MSKQINNLIAEELTALSSHYPVSTKTPAEQARWLTDFAADLGDLSAGSVVAACQQWRRSDAKRFPTPGHIRALGLEHQKSAALPSAQRIEAWRELSDAEYEALTLAEKIRHQKILAHEARSKAGPMWRNGRPAGPDELPARWHTWTALAKNHEAEARRLADILAKVKERSAEERGVA